MEEANQQRDYVVEVLTTTRERKVTLVCEVPPKAKEKYLAKILFEKGAANQNEKK